MSKQDLKTPVPDDVADKKELLLMVADLTHHVDMGSAYIETLGKERDALIEAARAYRELNTCYKLNRAPSTDLFKRLEYAACTMEKHRSKK